MGTWCTTPSPNLKSEASKNSNINKSLATKTESCSSKRNKKYKKESITEDKIDYSDFRNNPILKPAPLSNPQDTENNINMAMSLASAAKKENLKPKEKEKDIKEVKISDFGSDMKNINDDVNAREASITESIKRESQNAEIVVSFNPINLNKEPDDGTVNRDMSFGGHLIKERNYYASTIIKETDEISEHLEEGQEEFVFENNKNAKLTEDE